MGNYIEDDLRKMYSEIKSASYEDIFEKTHLFFKDFAVYGFSSPFKKIYINFNKVNKENWPEDAVRGLFAHELAHQVSYRRRSFLGRMFFIWNYPFSKSGRRRVEKEADEIGIERGYGKELVQERLYQFRNDNKKLVEKEKRVYLSVEALNDLIKEKN